MYLALCICALCIGMCIRKEGVRERESEIGISMRMLAALTVYVFTTLNPSDFMSRNLFFTFFWFISLTRNFTGNPQSITRILCTIDMHRKYTHAPHIYAG